MQEVRVFVGDEAVAATVMRPGGMVLIAGQRFSARSNGEIIEAGTQVIITGGDNHGFTVQRIEQITSRESLSNFGQPAYANFGSSKRAQALAEEEKMRQWILARKRWIRRVGPLTGAAFAAAGLGVLWSEVFASQTIQQAGLSAAGLLAIGAASGFVLLGLIDAFLRDIDFALARFSWPTLCLVFLGFMAGIGFALPRWGSSWGLLSGVVGSLLLGLPLPLITSLTAVGGTGNADQSSGT